MGRGCFTRREVLCGASGAVVVLALPGCGVFGGGDGVSGAGGEETRVVEHALGETEVPVEVGGVVAMGPQNVDASVALGVDLLGVAVLDVSDPFPRYLGEETEGVEVTGTFDEPNLEAIAALNPSVIIGESNNVEGVYERMASIAPTIATFPNTSAGWRENFRLFAEAVDEEYMAETLLEEYESRVEGLRSLVGSPEDITVSVIGAFAGEFSMFSKNSFAGGILDDVGFSRPASQDVVPEDGFDTIPLSSERLPDADADVIFLNIREDEDLELLRNNSLWQTLEAVRDGRVHRVSDTYAWFSGSILATGVVLEDLGQNLGG